MRRKGLSLVEVLVSVAILSVVIGAVTRTFLLGLSYQKHTNASREMANDRIRFEDAVSRLIAGANLRDTGGYLVSPIPNSGSGISPQQGSSILGNGSSSLVLTTSANAPSPQFLAETGQTFESLNSRFGPMGGLVEVAFSTVPVGDAGKLQGLFLRRQRPADSDLTQGGMESLLEGRVQDIRFEFYDGTQWLSAWDSQNDQKGKLPQLVRVTYVLAKEQSSRSFLVRLPQIGAAGATGGGSS